MRRAGRAIPKVCAETILHKNGLLEYFQAVKNLGERDLRLRTRFESTAGGKNNVLAAHHCGLTEAEHHAVFGCGFVTQRQWDWVPVRRPLNRWLEPWPLGGCHFIFPSLRRVL